MEMRRSLRVELEPLVTTFDEHPWNWAKEEAGTRTPRSSQYSRWNVGKDLSFIPLRPERVAEVRYDHMEGPALAAHGAVRPLAPRPYTAVVHVRAARGAGELRPLVDSRTKISYPERTGLTLMADPKTVVEVAGRSVPVSNPGKVYFPRTGHTKLDMVRYYLAVADGALGGVRGRPMALKRFVNGAEGELFFQKRAPEKRPDWIETVAIALPVGPDRGRGGAATTRQGWCGWPTWAAST